MDGGKLPAATAPLRAKRLADLIEQYRLTVPPHKRSSETACLRLGRMSKDPIAAKVLIDLTSAEFAAYRDRRLKLVKPGPVRRELYLFVNMIDTVTKEWGYSILSSIENHLIFATCVRSPTRAAPDPLQALAANPADVR